MLMGIGAPVLGMAADAPVACGALYTVERGDTLFRIAARSYSDGWLYKKIFAANGDILPDSGSLEIGDRLLIPCLDGTGPATRREALASGAVDRRPAPQQATATIAPAAAYRSDHPLQAANQHIQATYERFKATEDEIPVQEEPVQAAELPARGDPGLLQRAARLVQRVALPGQSLLGPIDGTAAPEPVTAKVVAALLPVKPELRFLTGSGFAPFADVNLPAGGMITDLVTRATRLAEPAQKFRVSFINDWPAHLDVLLRDGAFDIGFPWYKPDCANAERLSDEMRLRCTDFEFSNPILEVPVGFYTRADHPVAQARDQYDLFGKTLCRPAGEFSFDLEQSGLTTIVMLDRPASALECFVKLIRGQVDVVTLVKREAEDEIARRRLADAVTEIKTLATTQTLHALVAKSNPNGKAYLELINRGLGQLMVSGKWFETVAFHQRGPAAMAY